MDLATADWKRLAKDAIFSRVRMAGASNVLLAGIEVENGEDQDYWIGNYLVLLHIRGDCSN